MFSMIINHSGDSFFDRALKRLTGTRILKMGDAMMGRIPSPKQIRCSSIDKGTVLRECPPYSTQAN